MIVGRDLDGCIERDLNMTTHRRELGERDTRRGGYPSDRGEGRLQAVPRPRSEDTFEAGAGDLAEEAVDAAAALQQLLEDNIDTLTLDEAATIRNAISVLGRLSGADVT
jgi:hypothetical protein